MSTELFKKMAQSIIDGDTDVSVELAKQAISENIDPILAITDGYVVGVNTVGEAFAAGDAFLPELVMAGEAMKAAVATLEPEMTKQKGKCLARWCWQQWKAISMKLENHL